jgi:hypothetical protein
MPERAIVSPHPTEFFRELVQGAMQAQNVETAEEMEFYLVLLLERHLRMPGDLLGRPLALTYLEATYGAPAERFERFKRVGDTALFLSGLFTDCLERSLVPPSYYIDLGKLSYQQLAQSGARQLREMFADLALRFTDLVRVLGEISSRDLFASAQDTLRIYRRWVLTRSGADASQLVRRGIIPGEPSSKLRH